MTQEECFKRVQAIFPFADINTEYHLSNFGHSSHVIWIYTKGVVKVYVGEGVDWESALESLTRDVERKNVLS